MNYSVKIMDDCILELQNWCNDFIAIDVLQRTAFGERECVGNMTPKQARKLARKLIALADQLDPKCL